MAQTPLGWNSVKPSGASGPQHLDGGGALVVASGGSKNALNLTAGTTLIKAGAGTVSRIIFNTASSTTTSIYDSATTAGIAASNLIITIPTATGVAGYALGLEFPVANGIVIVVGTAGVVALSYN